MEKELRILIVEDVHADAELEMRELKRAGLRVAHRLVETEEAFRSGLKEFRPEIILSDFSMPHFDGMFALALAHELAPDVPFIFVSGTIGEEYAIRALKNGASDYVLKNNLVRLPAAVERALRDARDAAERKRAENQLRLQGAALNAAANAIMITRQDGTIRWVNRAFSTLTGYSAEEAIGQNPRILKSGQQGPEFYRRMFDTIHSGSMWQGEIVNRYKDGRLATEEMTITPVRGADGKIENFIAIKHDISARKEAELALRDSERKLAFHLMNTPIGAVEWNRDFQVVEWNLAAEQMFGYARAEALGKHASFIVPESFRAGLDQLWARLLLDQQGGVRSTNENVAKSGKILLCDWFNTPLKDDQGRIFGVTSLIQDITERELAEAKIRRLNRVYAVLSGINALIVRARDRDELFRESCRIAVEAGGFRMAWLGVVDRTQMRVKLVAWNGAGADYIALMPVRLGEAGLVTHGVSGEVVEERRAIAIADMAKDPRITLKKEALECGFRSVAMLPLMVDAEVVGVLALYAGEAGFFDAEEMKLLNELAGDISFALDHIQKKDQLDYLALYDPLTGLANRALFVDRLNRLASAAGQAKSKFAVAKLDIERLRTVNESLGRQAGDELLKQVALRLEHVLSKAAIGRVAADHFALVLDPVKGRSEAGRRVQEVLRACFGAPFEASGTEVRLSAKAGIVLVPRDGTDGETLLKHAEATLLKAKALGERYVFYSADLTERTTQTLTLENKLRQALEKEEFVLHYQPKVELETRRIVGVEALIRWQSPELGLVPPMKFIPLMEETGMILDVGVWALRRAATDHRGWVEQKLLAPRVAVNVSAIQLRQRDFVRSVEQAIIEGVAPTGIDLEITESLLMHDVEGNIEKLKAVRGLGMSIAIDDFGTGYSSLGYLAKLPVQTLKIDRAFIITMLNDPDTMTLVSTMISLAHSLRLSVVAESVETEEQAKMLRLLRCDQMQGYLFSKPLPLEEITAMLRQSQALAPAL